MSNVSFRKHLAIAVKSIALFSLAMVISLWCNAQYWQPLFLGNGSEHQYNGGLWGGGISAADFDKDGYDDLLFCQRGSNPLLFKSEEGTLQPWPLGIQNVGEIKQISWVDFDNDGDRDLSLTGFNMPVQLFQNVSGTLIPLPSNAGISQVAIVSYGHSWGDYDRDGDLDLFVCNYDAAYMGYVNSDNVLYRNEGNGVFMDVSLSAGFASMVNFTFMAIWMDYNRDLFPDLLVVNDRYEVPNYFYHNNGDGTFTEIAAQANLDDFVFGMTATAGDFDNDGDLDIYVTNGTSGNLHKINNGDGTFTDADEQLGTTLNRFCWSAQFIDADRDGLQDLHICSTPHVNLPGENFLYRNLGQVFVSATEEAGISTDGGWSRSSAFGDFNNDGLADIAVSKSAPSVSSIWSAEDNDNNWLKVTLEGVESNRDGVSSWIDCYTASGAQSRYTFCGEGYLGQNSFSEFFGLGNHELIDSLMVSWPSGVVDKWYNIPVNQQLFLVEGTSSRAVVTANEGFIYCPGDSLTLSLDGWSSVLWNTGSSEMSIRISEPGVIWAEVEDEWGNWFISDTVSVLQSTSPAINISISDVSCHGLSDGTISLDANGGDVQFELNNQLLSNGEATLLHAGQYEIHWTDSYSCTDSFAVLVNEPDSFVAEVFTQNVSCYGLNDGAVDFSFSGGIPGYYFIGENVLLTQLQAGDYFYIASDANGCLALLPFVILEPSLLEVEAIAEPDSNDLSIGSIECEASGGTPPYYYFLNSVPSDAPLWQELSAGLYELVVEDSMGCIQSAEISVESAMGIGFTPNEILHVYPNPVRSNQTLTIESTFPVNECTLHDVVGRLVLVIHPFSHLFSLDLGELEPGDYTICLKSGQVEATTRFILLNE